jgi:hypothetical protein
VTAKAKCRNFFRNHQRLCDERSRIGSEEKQEKQKKKKRLIHSRNSLRDKRSDRMAQASRNTTPTSIVGTTTVGKTTPHVFLMSEPYHSVRMIPGLVLCCLLSVTLGVQFATTQSRQYFSLISSKIIN